MEENKVALLTGSTGFLGSFLAKELLDKNYFLYLLARPKKNKSAFERVIESLKFVYEDEWTDKLLSRIKVISGDITQDNLGIHSKKEIEELIKEVEIIFHSAALAELRVPLEKIRKINVEGTRNILKFALKCKEKGRLKKVNHISTAYVVGKKITNFSEDMLDLGQEFNNTYEQSKFEAELLINEFREKGLKISIFRPSMIMGDSKTGKTNKFKIFYQLLHAFSLEIYKKFPANLKSTQNLINIDTVAKAVSILGEIEENSTYHIVSPEDTSVEFFMKLVSDYFGFKLPEFIPVEEFNFDEWSPVQKALAEPYIPYFNFKTKFLSQKTQQALKKYNFIYPKIDKNNFFNIFEYWHKKSFVRKSLHGPLAIN